MVRVELLCLGTGKASTHIYYGEPSTGFVIIQDGEPVLLMGAGLGIVRSCVYYCKKVPDTIYISHNHSDHAGELPLLLSVEAGKGRRKKVVAETQVMTRILNHRLGEYHESIELSNRKLSDLADFVDCPEQEMTSVTANLSIIPYRSQHSERCFGFVLFYMNRPILGWSSDSGFEPNFYQQISTQTPVLILDARQTGSYDHAAFDDVIEFERKLAAACDAAGVTRTAIYVTVYGTQAEVPTNPQALKIGQTLMLFEDFEPAPPGVVSNGQHPPSASLHNLNNGFSSSYPAAPTEPVRQETSVLHSPVRQGGYSQPYSQSHHSNPPQHNFVPQQGPVSPTLSARSQPRGRSIPRNSAQQRSSDIRNLLHHISDTDPRASEAGSRGYSYSIPGQVCLLLVKWNGGAKCFT